MTHPGGRRKKLTQERIKKISEAIENGNYASVACAANNIDASTYYRWLRYAEKAIQEIEDDITKKIEQGSITEEQAEDIYEISMEQLQETNIYCQFYHAIKKAEAIAEDRDVMLITAAAMNGNWQAAAFKLERKHPSKWGRKIETTLKEYPSEIRAIYVEGNKQMDVEEKTPDEGEQIVDDC